MTIETVTPDFSGVISVPKGPPKQMLSVERDGRQTLVRINYSSLSLLQSCARKSFYSLKKGWTPKAGEPPLIYGSAIHKALQVFYEHTAAERVLPENFEEHTALMANGYEAPEKHFLYEAVAAFVKAAEPLRGLADDDKRSISSGVWVLAHYFKTYLNDTYVIHTDEQGPIVERSFSVPFFEDAQLRIELFGQIDFALRNTITGEVLVGDHKTASQLGSDFMNRIKPNHQYTGYLFGAHKTLGCSSEHFLVNGIEVKAKPKTARGGPPKFIRQITRRTGEDFAELHWAVRDAVTNYLRWDEQGHWPIGSVDSCAQWGGCRYLNVCSAPNELRENILDAGFERESHG